jgi:hypothetical protein
MNLERVRERGDGCLFLNEEAAIQKNGNKKDDVLNLLKLFCTETSVNTVTFHLKHFAGQSALFWVRIYPAIS